MTILEVRVRPGARVSLLEPASDGPWRASLKSPPVDGKANEELIALVARHFGVRKSQVTIRSGGASRLKRVQVDD